MFASNSIWAQNCRWQRTQLNWCRVESSYFTYRSLVMKFFFTIVIVDDFFLSSWGLVIWFDTCKGTGSCTHYLTLTAFSCLFARLYFSWTLGILHSSYFLLCCQLRCWYKYGRVSMWCSNFASTTLLFVYLHIAVIAFISSLQLNLNVLLLLIRIHVDHSMSCTDSHTSTFASAVCDQVHTAAAAETDEHTSTDSIHSYEACEVTQTHTLILSHLSWCVLAQSHMTIAIRWILRHQVKVSVNRWSSSSDWCFMGGEKILKPPQCQLLSFKSKIRHNIQRTRS